jgi:tetratricopeptide (TPR) repeat protein
MIHQAPVVELTSESGPTIALAALESVLNAFRVSTQSFNYNYDIVHYKDIAVEFQIAFDSLSPQAKRCSLSCIHASDIGFIVSSLTVETIQRVLTCLSSLHIESSETDQFPHQISLSYEQYVALLEAYVDYPPITKLICGALGDESQDEEIAHGSALLHRLRCCGVASGGDYWRAAIHPLLRCLEFDATQEKGADCPGYLITRELIDTYQRICEFRLSNSSPGSLFGRGDEGEGEGDLLEVMLLVEEALQKLELSEQSIPSPLKCAFLIERYLLSNNTALMTHCIVFRSRCLNSQHDYSGALRDANEAIEIDPKSTDAHKCRYKVYRNMAADLAANQSDGGEDELDGNGNSDDEVRGKASVNRLLIKGACDALAGDYRLLFLFLLILLL